MAYFSGMTILSFIELYLIGRNKSHTMFRKILFTIACTFILGGLAHGQSTDVIATSIDGDYRLVKVDSILINKLEVVQITNYNPQTNQYLAYGVSTKLCMEIDANGKIIKELDLTGEGPGHFGRGMSGLVYLGNNKIIEGAAQYLIFDQDWNYLKQYVPGSGFIPVAAISNKVTGASINGQLSIIKPVDQNYFGSKKLEKDHFSKAKMVELINSKGDETKKVLDYPTNTVYRNEKTYFHNHTPHLSVNRSKQLLYLALPLEPKLYVYDLKSDFKPVESIDIGYDSFKEPEGIPYEDQHKNRRKGFGPTNERSYTLGITNSSIISLNSEGNVTIIVHQTGTKSSNFPNAIAARKVAKRQSKTITSFVKNGKIVLNIERRFQQLVRIDETKFISPYVNEDEELDYNKYYIYELQKTN